MRIKAPLNTQKPFMLDRGAIRRIMEDKLRAEIAAARAGDVGSLPIGPWPDDLRLGAGGLGADSLELMTLAASINEMFHIHDCGIEDFLLARRCFGQWLDLVVEARRLVPDRISFHTSGSSGIPKRCVHELKDLVAEADDHVALLRPSRILTAVPSHHIYGFIFTVLVPLRAGCNVFDLRGRLPDTANCRAGDVLVSFPDHWRFLARSLERLPPLTGTTSTAPMPAALTRDLRARGLRRLIEIYGSSETAGLGWRDDPDDPYTLLDTWTVHEAPPGEGQLSLTTPGREVATPDIVAMAGARRFHVRRRADGAVQVGGINVFPAHVAQVLERHPLIAHARVRLAPPHQGGRLKALVVPRDITADAEAIRRDVETWLRESLSDAELPRSLTIAHELPKGVLGKDADWTEVA